MANGKIWQAGLCLWWVWFRRINICVLNNFASFREWDVVGEFNPVDFFFSFPNSTVFRIDWVISMTVRTFLMITAGEFDVVPATLSAFLQTGACYVPLCPPFRYVRARTQRNDCYVPLCPLFRYVRDGFSSFRCIRVRT